MKFSPLWMTGAFLLNGCILPPPDAAGADAGSGNGEGAVSPEGDRFVIWDGDGAGAGAKGWSGCDKEQSPNCKVAHGPVAGKGIDGSMALHLHGDGPGWIGLGWNFIAWWPENGGYDLGSYGKLTLDIKVVAESEELAPDLGGVNIAMRCSKGKKDSNAVPVKGYAPELLNGEWHHLEIPLGEFSREEFDFGTVWEIDVSTWSGNPKKFDIYIDNIAVER